MLSHCVCYINLSQLPVSLGFYIILRISIAEVEIEELGVKSSPKIQEWWW